MLLLAKKKGVSIMVGYVLLVTCAIVMGVVVFQWVKTYVPADTLECPEGTSIFIKEYEYICETSELSLTLKNNGLFNIAGYFIHATDESGQELATIDLSNYTELGEGKGGTVLFGTGNSFEPNQETSSPHIFDLSDSGIEQIYSIEIIPVRFQEEEGKERFVSCGGSKVGEMVSCLGNCTPNCVGKECGDNGCGGSCHPNDCVGEYGEGYVCNSEGVCISEENCTDTCSSLEYECGNWTICGVETTCEDCSSGYSCVLGTCIEDCVPDCVGKECGTDGCGGSCGNCSSGYICEEGICNEECISHSYSQCYDNDVYWYDSCDNREEKKEECSYGCEDGSCKSGGGGGGCPYIYACSQEECTYVHDAYSHSFMKSLEDYSYQTYKGKLDYIKITEPFKDEISYINDFKVYGIDSDNLFLPEEENGVLHSIREPQQPYDSKDNSYYFKKQGDNAKIIINARHTGLQNYVLIYLWDNLGANWFEFYDSKFSLPIINKIWRNSVKQFEMRILVNGKNEGSIRAKSDVIDNKGEDFLVYVPKVKEDELNITLDYIDGWYVINSVTIDFSEDVKYNIEEIETDFSSFNIGSGEEKIINLKENLYDNYLFKIKGWYKPYWALTQNKTFKQSSEHFVKEVLPSVASIDVLSYAKRNSKEIEKSNLIEI